MESKKIKKAYRYNRKFRASWLQNKNFKEWIDCPMNSENSAHCKVCKIDIKGSKSKVERHCFTSKHKKFMKKNGPKVINEIEIGILDENELEDEEEEHIMMETVGDNYESDFQDSYCENGTHYIINNSRIDYSKNIPEQLMESPKSKSNKGSEAEVHDHLTAFGLYIGYELRRVPSTYAKQLAKCKINNVMFEATTGAFNQHPQYEPNDSSSFSNSVSDKLEPT